LPERVFQSNADEIRFYVKQLLSDYQEHCRNEILSHIRHTPNGGRFTEGMITGALKTLVDTDRASYTNFKRGWYKAINPESYENAVPTVTNSLATKIKNVLEETKSKLNEACTFNILNVSSEEFTIAQKVNDLIKYIEQFEANTL
jgi:hypothetical protein